MAVVCSHCGEELMGAVNRCWRCGQKLVVHSGPQDVPPVRRSPVVGPLDAPLEAVIVEETVAGPARTIHRTGSPFAAHQPTLRVAAAMPAAPVEKPRARPAASYESQLATQLAAVVALVLGVVALILAPNVPIAALCLALVVLGFGIWGLFGRRRGVALCALLLGCMALAWGGFGTVVQCYELLYGVHPFARSLPPPVEEFP